MEVKKSKKADLENKRSLFFQMGLIITLGVVFVAFEWSTTQVDGKGQFWVEEEVIEEEAPPVTVQDEIKPPPPPPPPVVSDILEIVDNDVELDEELEIEDSESDEDIAIDLSQLEEEEESGDPLPFYILEDKPEFPGGDQALLKYINQNVRYPVICQENGIQGIVSISFVIYEKGRVTNVKSIRSPDPNLEREAVRVVKTLPDWKPGKQRGRPVKVSFSVPVRFVLQ